MSMPFEESWLELSSMAKMALVLASVTTMNLFC
jgi:hypothetical protein